MNFQITKTLVVFFLTMTLAACVSTSTNNYRGDMELLSVSGNSCSANEKPNTRIPLELVLEQSSSSNGQQITGYISGSEILTGKLSGNDFAQLQVVYPDESDFIARGHTLLLTPTPEGMRGDLREKPQGAFSGCYFEHAILQLKHIDSGNNAKVEFDRQRKLFISDEYFNKGQVQLKANSPEGALRDFIESQGLRSEVDSNDPNSAYKVFSIATAQVMVGKESDALAILRQLFKEKYEAGADLPKLRFGLIRDLCAYTYETKDDVRQKAAEQLLDSAARSIGRLDETGAVFAECYREMGRDRIDQGEPDQSIEYFQKALVLNPNDAESVAGIIIGNIERETPTEGRKFLQEHAQILIDKTGRETYNFGLSQLFVAEAIQAEKIGDFTQAEKLLREALKINPNERALIFNLASILEKLDKPDDAHKLLETGSSGCQDETCRLDYAKELARHQQIESIVKRLKTDG
jgi:tetratricopeptide (TPR) repeat protein